MSELNGRPPKTNVAPKPTRASMREEFHAAVECGDFGEVFHRLLHQQLPMLTRGEGNAALARAIELASLKSPASFSREVFRQTISFCVMAQLRLQLQAARALNRADDTGELPRELADSLWPQLCELVTRTAELLRTQAATARYWALTQRRRARTGRRAPRTPRL